MLLFFCVCGTSQAVRQTLQIRGDLDSDVGDFEEKSVFVDQMQQTRTLH